MEYTKKDTVSFSLSCVAIDISKQRVVFVGETKKSESWDIYIDIRIIQNVVEGTRKCDIMLTGQLGMKDIL